MEEIDQQVNQFQPNGDYIVDICNSIALVLKNSSIQDIQSNISEWNKLENNILPRITSMQSVDEGISGKVTILCETILQIQPTMRSYLFQLLHHLLQLDSSCYPPLANALSQSIHSDATLSQSDFLSIAQFLLQELYQTEVYSEENESAFMNAMACREGSPDSLNIWFDLLSHAIQVKSTTIDSLYSLFLQQLDCLAVADRLAYLLSKPYSLPFLQWFSNRTQFIQHPNECILICIIYSYLCDQQKEHNKLGFFYVEPSSSGHASFNLLLHSLSTLCEQMHSAINSLPLSFLGSFLNVVFCGEYESHEQEHKNSFIQLARVFFTNCDDHDVCNRTLERIIMFGLTNCTSWRLETIGEILTFKLEVIEFSEDTFLSLIKAEKVVMISKRHSYLSNLMLYLFQPFHCMSLNFIL